MHGFLKRSAARRLGLSSLLAVLVETAACLEVGDVLSELVACQELCAVEAQCADVLGRSEDECLASLCDETGFRQIEEPTDESGAMAVTDLENLAFIACAQEATDCAALALCSCSDACARSDQCVGSEDATCEDTCEALIQQEPTLYRENRCKMESSCDDLPLCGQVSG